MFTEFHYMYRDASNYKHGKMVLFEGAVTDEQRADISKTLNDGMYFIPDDVELEELQQHMTSFPSQDDHVWHEVVELTIVEAHRSDAMVAGPVENLVEAFRKVGDPLSWDVEGAMQRLGISSDD
jgi:hypothetical protein